MIETVLGPVEAASLGVASMHDHLLIDARILHAPAREPLPEDPRVTLENLGFVRWNLLALEDNLVLDDPALAASELARAGAEGQRAVVDPTCWGSAPPTSGCRRSRGRAGCTSSRDAGSTSTGRIRIASPRWTRARSRRSSCAR